MPKDGYDVVTIRDYVLKHAKKRAEENGIPFSRLVEKGYRILHRLSILVRGKDHKGAGGIRER